MPQGIGAAIGGVAIIVVLAFIASMIIHNPIVVVIVVAVAIGVVMLARGRRRARNRV